MVSSFLAILVHNFFNSSRCIEGRSQRVFKTMKNRLMLGSHIFDKAMKSSYFVVLELGLIKFPVSVSSIKPDFIRVFKALLISSSSSESVSSRL